MQYVLPGFGAQYLEANKAHMQNQLDSPVLKELIEQWRRETRITVQVRELLINLCPCRV
jgi:hypothetical protein